MKPLHRVMAAVAATFLCSQTVAAADRDDIDFVTGSSLPPEIWEALGKGSSYAVAARINPFYLQGDFDGDGRRDTAVLVKERATGKIGFAVVFAGGKVRIAGGGRDTGDGTDNLDWMDAWYVVGKGRLSQGATDQPPPLLKGDGVMVIRTESASAVIYWDGKAFRWYQQGD